MRDEPMVKFAKRRLGKCLGSNGAEFGMYR